MIVKTNATLNEIIILIKKFIIESGLIHTNPITPAAPEEIFNTLANVQNAAPAADPTIAV